MKDLEKPWLVKYWSKGTARLSHNDLTEKAYKVTGYTDPFDILEFHRLDAYYDDYVIGFQVLVGINEHSYGFEYHVDCEDIDELNEYLEEMAESEE